MAKKIDLKEILVAYWRKLNPSERQEKLAEERTKICDSCEHPKTNDFGFRYCDICGCVISAKVYSPKENPCPLEKWKCDIPYFTAKVDKNKLI